MSLTHHRPFIKICGQTHQSACDNATACGASHLGFIFHPRSPRSISVAHAASIRSLGLKRVGVFVLQKGDEIRDIMQRARLHYAQLHGKQSFKDAQQIGADRVIRVLWPARYENQSELQADITRWAPYCAYFLLDAGTEGGGHGQSILLEQLAGLQFPKPWILAGGINSEKIAPILQHCQPDGLDINSAIEYAPGHKHPRLCLDIFKQLHRIADVKEHD